MSEAPVHHSFLSLDDVCVDFPIYNAHGRSLKRSLLHMTTGGRLGLGPEHHVMVRALSKVTLNIRQGDRVGLLGHNGAGKTTLLRVLSGAYEPTAGVISRRGRVGALFDITLGMDMEATGNENIFTRGILMGLSRKEIEARKQEIAEFSELGDYLEVPCRTYSTGMLLRLAFAVSTSVNPDILLMDEWISAGDAGFVRKAEARLEALVGNSGILVLASHSMQLLRRVCTTGVFLRHGEVVMQGAIDEVSDAYEVP